ncbi:MAG TPA: cytochrome c [Kofleriaceae bacterium]|nr:cytochrome c [Kofleriaceae bacterium]
MRAVWIVIVVGACSSGSVAGDVKDGKAVFAQACSTCHGPTGKPDETMAAKLGVRDLTAPEFHARATKELVVNQVRRGSANHIMPSFEGGLTDQQIDAVAAYVLTLAK